MIIKPYYLLGLFFLISFQLSQAQVDLYRFDADTVDQDTVQQVSGTRGTVVINNDSIPKDTTSNKKKNKPPRVKKPKVPWKAAVMSGCLPGLGQFYNGKWWKVPIVWGALGTCGYFIAVNHIDYIGFRDAYRQYDQMGTVPTGYEAYNGNPTGLQSQRDFYQRTRDLVIIIGAALWALNVVDASVDAHLSTFDVSDDLSLNIQPSSFYIPQVNQSYLGVSLNLGFGKKKSKFRKSNYRPNWR